MSAGFCCEKNKIGIIITRTTLDVILVTLEFVETIGAEVSKKNFWCFFSIYHGTITIHKRFKNKSYGLVNS